MKTFLDWHAGAPHDVLGGLAFFAGLIAVVCVFWLHPFWTTAALTGAGLAPAVYHSAGHMHRNQRRH